MSWDQNAKLKSFVCFLGSMMLSIGVASAEDRLHAGAARLEISPRQLPAIRNGGFLQSESDRVDDPLYARCLVLADGKETIAIAVVDSCMLPTDICDAIKSSVSKRIGLPANRILICATHTHSAPSAMSYCLGSSRDDIYVEFLVPRVADTIVAAAKNMKPAKIGWNSIDASELTNCRRWITRSDQMEIDPFGQQTVRAMMHPGHQNPNYVSPAGPVDPELFVLSVIAAEDGAPLCLMANFSMHYFGGGAGFSADYFGEVADLMESNIVDSSDKPARDFVGIMSQGTSGDLHWMNYGQPRKSVMRSEFSQTMAEKILAACKQIEYQSDPTIAMSESRLALRRRVPNTERLAWAKSLNDRRANQSPRDRPEVYAQQAQWIHENPETEVVLQAIRIGELGITALPNEVFGITGLKLKQQSPLGSTFNLELANGAEGYIPPPEQHRLGGYTTWPARTAGLEIQAEPKIVDTVLSLLESVSGKPRREYVDSPHDYARTVIKLNPVAYWRLGDMDITRASDTMGQHHARFDGGVALCLPGPSVSGFEGTANHCVYFAGGSLQARIPELSNEYSVSMCFWNGLPTVRSGDLGRLFFMEIGGTHESLSIDGNKGEFSRLALQIGSTETLGKTPLVTREWHHLTLTRSGSHYAVFLDGQAELDIDLPMALQTASNANDQSESKIIGGQFDGKLDEVALFDRALSANQAQALFQATGITPPRSLPPPAIVDEKPFDTVSLARYADAVQRSRPAAYWRLHDSDDKMARDEMGRFDAAYEPKSQPRCPGSTTRNFSGGRVLADVPGIGNRYSVELWMRNEMSNSIRPVTAYFFTRGANENAAVTGDCLGIGGTHAWTGRLFVYNGNQREEAITGNTPLVRGSWNHVVLTRDGANIKVYLNGKQEIDGQLPVTYPEECQQWQLGGRNDNFANLQGMLDEVSLFDRVLSSKEVETHFLAADVKKINQPKTEDTE